MTRREPQYWRQLGTLAVRLTDLMNHQGGLDGAVHTITTLHCIHGPEAITDLAAILVGVAQGGCPDALIGSDGRPDPQRVLRGAAADVLHSRGFAAAQPLTGPMVTHGTRRGPAGAGQVTPLQLVSAALVAAPRMPTLVATLRPAARDVRLASGVLAYAILAVRNVENALLGR